MNLDPMPHTFEDARHAAHFYAGQSADHRAAIFQSVDPELCGRHACRYLVLRGDDVLLHPLNGALDFRLSHWVTRGAE
jgi:hypothetical protein